MRVKGARLLRQSQSGTGAVTDNTRDKVIALEVKVDNLSNKVSELTDAVKVLNELLLQAKGARWMIGILIAIGGVMSGFALKYIPFLPLPR